MILPQKMSFLFHFFEDCLEEDCSKKSKGFPHLCVFPGVVFKVNCGKSEGRGAGQEETALGGGDEGVKLPEEVGRIPGLGGGGRGTDGRAMCSR